MAPKKVMFSFAAAVAQQQQQEDMTPQMPSTAPWRAAAVCAPGAG
jgi:hypothetical protein